MISHHKLEILYRFANVVEDYLLEDLEKYADGLDECTGAHKEALGRFEDAKNGIAIIREICDAISDGEAVCLPGPAFDTPAR